MATTTFIPSKPKKGKDRVQLSVDEMAFLIDLVSSNVQSSKGLNAYTEMPLKVLLKLRRAYRRIATS
ncbi:hypothetical protein ES703_32098 [subsurface metagenome]